MLINVFGVWINPMQIKYLTQAEVDSKPMVYIWFSDTDHRFVYDVRIDLVAAEINNQCERMLNNGQKI